MELVEADLDSGKGYRQWRLFLCGVARRVVHLTGRRTAAEVVEAAELYADGVIDYETLRLRADVNYDPTYWNDRANPAIAANNVVQFTSYRDGDNHTFNWVAQAIDEAASAVGNVEVEHAVQAQLFKDVFGNPFQPPTFDPSWRTSTAAALASAMYESRNFDAMPILADALEDAGCDSTDVLAHCRGDGPHVRGCWVVDLVLGKS